MMGNGRRGHFCPQRPKTDVIMRNKNLARIYNHLLTSCRPDDVKTKLKQAKNVHQP
jgi:hypothetical protein